MFSRTGHKHETTDEYQNRIVELEAELAAAQRLIASQRQVLQSNIEANIVDDEGNSAAPLEENVLPPLKPLQMPSYPDKRPLKLPAFGASTGDMAQRVFQAAVAQGIINDPALQSPSDSREHMPRAASEPNDEPTLLPSNPKRELSRSLLVSSALLLGAVLTVGLRSIHASPPSQSIHAFSQTAAPMPFPARTVIQVSALPSSAASPREQNTAGPVLEPVSSPPRTSQAIHKTIKRNAFVKRSAPERQTAILAVSHSGFPRQRTLSKAVAVAPQRHPHSHRYHLSRVSSDDDWFEREARRHAEPGWDEKEDAWLDDY